MNALARAAIGGLVGSITTNLLHELTRRSTKDAPRVDLLGMQAFAKGVQALGVDPPSGRKLYVSTLVADLVTNAAYFSLVACASRRYAVASGAALGVLAGVGAVLLPRPLGLAAQTTARTSSTRILTVALYSIGGTVAGMIFADANDSESDNRFFAQKHVVITGGTRGLGFVLARHILNAGANVTICGRSRDTLERAIAKLGSHQGSLGGIVCDVRDPGACERLITQSAEARGPIDVLINNAGVIEVGPLALQTLDDFREAMDTHFWAPLHLIFAVLPAMRARRGGSIVNIASIGGLVGVPHLAPYSASKFAQVGFTQALAAETAADGVHVTSVTPGLMITGSPDHAIFKGNYRAEYAWFTLSDSNPLVSVPVEAAARRILRGIRRHEAQVTIGWTAKMAKTLNVLFPELTAFVLRVAAQVLPPAGGIGTARRTGSQSHSKFTQNPLTLLNSRTMDETNQHDPLGD